MAEEIVDALVLQARFESAGFERQAAAKIGTAISGLNEQVARAAQGLEFNINVGPFIEQVERAGQSAGAVLENIRDSMVRTAQEIGDAGGDVGKLTQAIAEVSIAEEALAVAAGKIPTGPMLDLVRTSLIAAERLREAGLAEEDLNKALRDAGLLTEEFANHLAKIASEALKSASALREARAEASALGKSSELIRKLSAAAPPVVPPVNLSPLIEGMNRAANSEETAAARARDAGVQISDMMKKLASSSGTLDPFIAKMEKAALSVESLAAASDDTKRRVGGLGPQLGLVAKGGSGAEAGIARVRSGLAQLAIVSAHTTSPLGQVAQGLLFIGGVSSVGIIAVAAAVLGLVLGFEKLTEATRRAKEAQENLRKAFFARAEGPAPGTEQEAERLEILRRQNELLAEQANLHKLIGGFITSYLALEVLGFKLRVNKNEELRIEQALTENLLRKQKEDGAAQRERNQKDIADAERLNQLRAQGVDEQIRFAAQLAAIQQPQSLQPQPIPDNIIQSFRDRLALAKEITAQDIASLRAQQTEARKGLSTANSQAEQQAILDRTKELEKEIALRQKSGDIQVQQINNELALLAATTDRANLEKNIANAVDDRQVRTQRLRDASELNRIQQQGLEAQIQFQQQLAEAQGKQTFGPEPGVVSQEVLTSFQKRLDLIHETTQAEIDQRRKEQRIAAEAFTGDTSDQVKRAARDTLVRLEQEIKVLQAREGIQTKAIKNELALLKATKERIQLEEDHLQRVKEAGGGNILGANLQFPSSTITLPTEEDIQRLAEELAKVPPVGLPQPEEVRRAWEDALNEARKRNIPLIQQGQIQQGLVSGAGAKKAEEERLKAARDLSQAFRDAARLIADSTAEAIGLNRVLRAMVGNVFDVLDGFAQIKQANIDIGKEGVDAATKLAAQVAKIGGIASIIASGISIVGGIGKALFGGGQSEHDRILDENSKRLAELAAELKNFTLGDVGGLADIAKPLSQGGGGFIGFFRALEDAGLTLEQFADIARQKTGIEILDEKGRLVAETMDQLREAVDRAREAALNFRTDLDSERTRLANQDRIFGAANQTDEQRRTAELERARQVQLDALNLSAAEEARVNALKLSTKEGREAFRKWEQEIAQRALTHQLTKEELGGFENVDQLLGDLADTVDILNQAMQDASKEMKNIPDTFKLAAAEFSARAVDIVPIEALPPKHRGTDFNPKIPGGTDGSMLPTTNVTGNVIQIILPALPKNATTQDMARAVANELEIRAVGGFGLAPPP